MGRNTIPDEIKAKKGTLKPCRVNKNQPDVELIKESSTLKIPTHLNIYGKNFYKDIYAKLIDLGVLSENDLTALELMASEYGVYIQAQYELKKNGYVVMGTNKNGASYQMISPWVGIAATKLKLLNGMMSKFGLNPSDRTKITTIEIKDDKDEMSEFINGNS